MSEDKRQLSAGTYEGEIEDYGISKNSKGDAQAFIKFKIMKGEGEGFAELTWYGGLSNAKKQDAKKSPAEYTIATLLDCGFKGMEVEDLATGPHGNSIDPGRVMSLAIEDNDYEGKIYSRIKYINALGAGGPKKLTKEELTGKTDTSALRAILMTEKPNSPDNPSDGIGF